MAVLSRNRRIRLPGSGSPQQMLYWAVVGSVVAYLMFFFVFGRMGLIAQLRLTDEAQRISGEIALARQDIQSLSRTTEALTRDPNAIERIARERLGMVRPGETVFLFETREDSPAPVSPEALYQP